ncbi:hypothetical protein CDAR_612841 [Caerostris darwini]|uniref:LAGLIDADG homing endonuclease n=1 Tax=Caerostris darwini TaxID=1538125 RepID=A0AAV4TSS2_9ARAC|nr:hypothetical protein CDAR_612841 [Caerostris darwini]
MESHSRGVRVRCASTKRCLCDGGTGWLVHTIKGMDLSAPGRQSSRKSYSSIVGISVFNGWLPLASSAASKLKSKRHQFIYLDKIFPPDKVNLECIGEQYTGVLKKLLITFSGRNVFTSFKGNNFMVFKSIYR